ncbi:MAG: hypothetical protein AAF127_04705 [Pseudomonadota bacterium]
MKRFTTAFSLVLISTAAPVWAQEEPSEMQHYYQGEFVSVERDVGQEDGVTSGTVAVQTNSGNGATRTFERGVDEANQSAARSSQITTNQGQTLAKGASANCDGSGTCSANRSTTGLNGDTVEANRSISQTETGFARSGGVTGPQRAQLDDAGFRRLFKRGWRPARLFAHRSARQFGLKRGQRAMPQQHLHPHREPGQPARLWSQGR